MERKRVKGYYVAAALLLLWAAADFYHHFFIGVDLTANYQDLSSVQLLVRNTLFQGIIKTALGLVVFAVGWFRGKEKPRPRSLTAITGLLSALTLALWGISTGLITAATAEYGGYQVQAASDGRAYDLSDTLEFNMDRRDSWPNGQEIAFWETVSTGAPRIQSYGGSCGDHFLHLWEDSDIYSAIAIYDSGGDLLSCSWQDSMYLQYMTEDEWIAGEDVSRSAAIAHLERECLTEVGQANLGPDHVTLNPSVLRLTGSFDGTTFLPARIEGVLYEDVEETLWEKGSGTYILSDLIEDYGLPWYLLYENAKAAEAQPDTVTLYADYIAVNWREVSPSFSYQGRRYPDLVSLMEEIGPALALGAPAQPSDQYQWRDLVQISVSYRMTASGMTYWSSHYYGEDAYQEEAPEVQYYLVNIVYAAPLWDAVLALRQTYLLTLALALVLLVTVRSRIRQHLVTPVTAVVEAMEDNWKNIYRPESAPAPWAEAQRLGDGYAAEQDRRRMKDNEITRLNTALAYAKEAETERRQMTSHMAHELKTPLAVIHCCCEGLREDIAPEKRQQYLDTILSEAEELDAMVLEMLDLSRLEAGKVKLSRDDFDLAEMARAVFRRLEAAAADRELTVELSCGAPCPVSADEGRLRQAMGNLAANAVRYAPAGSTVRARVWREGNWTCFAVENDSPPFTREELEKIWERFYRREEDRSGRGTGLGLAITRQIVELHGGRCRAENIPGGVRFQLSVPN